MAPANLKPCILRTLEAREFILSTAIEAGVVYSQTGNESLLVSGHGSTYDRTLAGGIGPIFSEIQSTVAHKH